MLSIGRDIDCHLSADSGQLAGSGIGGNQDSEVWLAAAHDPRVMENEAAAAAMQSSRELLNGNVSAGFARADAAGQHLTLGRAFEVAVILLIEKHTRQAVAVLVVLRNHLYLEWTGSVLGHERLSRNWLVGLGLAGRGHEHQDSEYAAKTFHTARSQAAEAASSCCALRHD